MKPARPPLLLRLAVVVGAFTTLLGAVGVVFMILRSDETASASGSGLGELVRVVGVEDGDSLTVNVHWEEGPILHKETARRIAAGAALYLLPPDLVGRNVVIEVLDAETSHTLAGREVVLRKGEEIRIEIDRAAER